MSVRPGFEVQGHRGARGLRPENTLPSFELALDLGVTSIETDLHRTRDGVPVLFHDATVSTQLCTLVPGRSAPPLADRPRVSALTLTELRAYRVDRNPAPGRFPEQRAHATALAQHFASERGIDPLGIPTLAELFAFVAAYAREPSKTAPQRQGAPYVVLDLELKTVRFAAEANGLEQAVLDEAKRAGALHRIRVRSFDHRSVQRVGQLHPGLPTAVLIAHTPPVQPADLTLAAGATLYCPDYRFTDASVVQQIHAAEKRIMPWTVNDPADWARLIDWGVDGITTDFPDQLLDWLRRRDVG